MAKFDIVCFGSSTRDVFVQISQKHFGKKICFFPGAKIQVKSMGFFSGGGATNTAVGFSRLGLKAGVVSAVGNDDDGKSIRKELESEGVDCKNLFAEKQKPTSYSIILTGFGRDRVILNYAGASALLNHRKKINWKALDPDWFYVSSLHQKPALLKKVFSFARQKKIKVAFNPGMSELSLGLSGLKKMLSQTDILVLNEDEAKKLAGSTSVEKNLLVLGKHCGTVVVTNGEKKTLAFFGGKIFSCKPFNVQVLDTSGAGDAFASGFVAGIIKGKETKKALEWGTSNACSVIQFLGTKNVLLTERQIRKALKDK